MIKLAKIFEHGSGFPRIGDHISDGSSAHLIVGWRGWIQTSSIAGNWALAEVVGADGADFEEHPCRAILV